MRIFSYILWSSSLGLSLTEICPPLTIIDIRDKSFWIASNLPMVSQTSRQLRGAICGNSCYITQIKVFLAQILIYTVQFWQNYFWTQKLMRCLLYLSDIRSGKYFSDNAINILCGEKSDWSGSRVCVDHTGDGGRNSSGGVEERRRASKIF